MEKVISFDEFKMTAVDIFSGQTKGIILDANIIIPYGDELHVDNKDVQGIISFIDKKNF